MRNQLLDSAKIIILAIVLSFGLSYVMAWTAPTATPPAGNVSAPINTSATAQTKIGGITVGSLTTAGIATVGSLNAGNGSISTATNISGWGVLADHVVANNITLSSAGGALSFYDNTSMNTAPTPHGKQRFLTSGNFVVPPGVTEVWVTLSAGGGGGAGATYYLPVNPPGSPGGNSGLIKNRFGFPTYPVIAYGGAGGTSASGGAGGVVGGDIDPNFGVVGGAGTRLTPGTGGLCLGAGGGNVFGSGGALGTPGNGYGSGGGSVYYLSGTTRLCNGGGGAGGAIIAQKIAVNNYDDFYVLVGAGGAAGYSGSPTYFAGSGAPGFVLIEW